MNEWTISKRINAITISLIGMIVVIAGVGFFASLSIGRSLTDVAESSRELNLAHDIGEDLFEAEAAEKLYRLNASEEAVAEFDANIAEIAEVFAIGDQAIEADPELQPVWASIEQTSSLYESAFGLVQTHQAERDAAIAQMLEAGPQARATLNSLSTTFIFDRNDRATAEIGNAREQMLLSRIYSERYLLSNNPEYYETAAGHNDSAKQHLANVQTALSGDESRLGQLASVVTGVETSWSAFESAVASTEARNALRSDMTNLANELLSDVDSMTEMLVDRQLASKAVGSTTRNFALLVLAIFAAVAVMCGFFLAQRISTSISTAIQGSVETMTTLAEGNLDIEIDGTEAEHELGDVARALVIFRDNGKDALDLQEQTRKAEEQARIEQKAREEREAKAEADRQQQAEIERQAMIASLKESLGSVVDAAAAGDFTGRIDTRFNEAALDDMATSINTLVANVEKGLSETARVMSELSHGNLTERMDGEFSGMFADLKSSVNGTIDNLSDLVSEIAVQCDGLSDQSQAMTTQAGDLARRAEQQAASLEESSAVMEEMSASAKSSAEGAGTVSKSATETSGQVEEAGKIVQNAVAAMADIRDASQRIGEIVSVIDGIAFQTNLLALNASVEAARAGSAGKGFAVVAAEVRALAQRSGEASQDIKALIDESTTQVARGVDLVEKTGTTLNEIVDGVRNMASVMGDLATTAHEQATGVTEASSAITQMDMITQKNATLAEESRETAANVRAQTETMRNKVSTFRTDAGTASFKSQNAIAAE